MNYSDEISIYTTKRSQLWLKIFLVFIMCLAGSNICMMLYLRGIRGLDLAMWYLVGVCVLTIGAMVYCWPQKPKAKPIGSKPNLDPVYWETEQDRKAEFMAKCLEKLHINRKRL